MTSGMSGLSGLGLLPMQSATTDEEKWRRLAEITDRVKSRPGTVTKRHIHALGTRLGFGLLPDELTDLPSAQEVSLAGRTVMLDLHFSPEEEVTRVTVQNPEASTNLQAATASAAAVFHDCLAVQPGQSTITTKLDRFAMNLEKLSKIDKPHGTAGDRFNGFEAISGIYNSLRKLYDYEREMAMQAFEITDEQEEKAVSEVTCRKSGRPRMNENGRIGLDLDYWISRRQVRRKAASEPPAATGRDPNVFSVSVLCEAMQPGQMTGPARISDTWISDQVVKPAPDDVGENTSTSIDWMEPPPTFVNDATSTESASNAPLDQVEGKLPSVKFVAKLEPPLLVPGEAATQSGLLQCSSYHTLPTYINSLLLTKEPLEALSSPVQMPPGEIVGERNTIAGADGGTEFHTNTLRMRTFEQAILVHDIAFDHPKQLIELLPVSNPRRKTSLSH